MKKIIDLERSSKKVLSAKKFLELSAEAKRDIKSTRFVPPPIGSRGFGKFVVTAKTPTYSFADGKK